MRNALALLFFLALGACARPMAPLPARAWGAQVRGCDDIYLVVPDATKKDFLVIETSREKLGLRTIGAVAQFDIAHDTSSSVFVESYPREGMTYCTDVSLDEPKRAETWPAVHGRITITLAALRSDADFDVMLEIDGVVVRHPDGALEPIPDARFPSVRVGWLPG